MPKGRKRNKCLLDYEPLHVNAPRIVVIGLLKFDDVFSAPAYDDRHLARKMQPFQQI